MVGGTLASGATATLELATSVANGTSGQYLALNTHARSDNNDLIPGDNDAGASVLIQSWGARLRTGTYTGNGLATRGITGLGFRPAFVLIKGYTNKAAVVTTSTMVTSGVKELGLSNALVANVIRSLDTNGFTVGADQRVNNNNTIYSWIASEAAPGAMVVGSYLGNGSNSHAITGVGFQPDYAIVVGGGLTQAAQRFSSEAAGKSTGFDPGTESNNTIKSFDTDGFTVGQNADANGNGGVYFYAAWQALPTAMSVGGYSGSGIDNTPVSGAGFTPQLVIVKSKAYNQSVHRTASMVGDATLRFTTGNAFTNSIQRVMGDGFEAGTGDEIRSRLEVQQTRIAQDVEHGVGDVRRVLQIEAAALDDVVRR